MWSIKRENKKRFLIPLYCLRKFNREQDGDKERASKGDFQLLKALKA